MILFLDFDGVLHPELQEESSFCYLPRLERVLDDYPHVRVVISSAWRERLSLQALRELFSEPLRHRIVGVTPLPNPPSGCAPARREREIVAWLEANGGVDQPWVALDDAEWQFERHTDRLVACGSLIGFDGVAETVLREYLARAA